MGLDQYLTATKYVSESIYQSQANQDTFSAVLEAVKGQDFVGGFVPSAKIDLSVGYWRKANQIHRWFVDNCGRGIDECQEMYVGREQLSELLTICLNVKAGGKEVAEELLPPCDGFFFGSTEIDESYWSDIDDTIEQLERVLKDTPQGWEFQYRSSW